MSLELLSGAVDLHIHSGPDIFPRNVTAISAGVAAKAAGMGAIVVKSHITDTSARAETARELTGFDVYGGVVLNYSVGGLNPFAVRECAHQGGRLVWMPTINSRHFISNPDGSGFLATAFPPGINGITVLNEDRELVQEALDVLDEVVANDLILASGHLAATETIVLFTEAVRRGAKRLILTHPHVPFVNVPTQDQKTIADLGAIVEITDHGTVAERLAVINTVGADRVLLSTDGGTVQEPTPVERLTRFIQMLQSAGISDEDIHKMTVTNPSKLLLGHH